MRRVIDEKDEHHETGFYVVEEVDILSKREGIAIGDYWRSGDGRQGSQTRLRGMKPDVARKLAAQIILVANRVEAASQSESEGKR